MKTTIFSCIALVASITTLAACGAEAPSDEAASAGPEPEVIAERQDNYKAISDSFKTIRTQLEGDSPDFAAIEAAATDMNTRALKIPDFFPTGTSVEDGYDTEALPTIWEKPDEFAAASKALADESATMMTLAASGDAAAVAAQVGKVGGTCKACHDQFRLKDD